MEIWYEVKIVPNTLLSQITSVVTQAKKASAGKTEIPISSPAFLKRWPRFNIRVWIFQKYR